MKTLAEIRAAMKAKSAEIRAAISELDAATGDAVAALKAKHDALVAEYDALAEREARLVAQEARDATLASLGTTGSPGTESRTAGQGDGGAATGGAGVGEGEEQELTASEGLGLIEEARAYGSEVETEIRTAVAKKGAKASEVRMAILKAAAERQKKATSGITIGAAGQADERQTMRDAVENALMHRSKPGVHKLSDAGRQFRGMTLIEIGRDMLERAGESTRGLSHNEIAQRSLMSTSDFPLTLANVTNRTLRDAYQASPRTFQPLAREISLSDFKAAHRVKIGDAPKLLPVQEDGEFKRGAMSEGDEQIKLSTFGRVVGITRQVVINDDLGAFTRLPEMLGIQAANLESDIVWGLILGNPTLLTDNTALFNAAKHNNLLTGASSALLQGSPAVANAGAIATGRVNMAKQVGDGDGASPLNIRPKFIVVPTELEIPVQQILFGIIPNQTGSVVPEAIRSLQAISEPRLSTGVNGVAGSATAWYLFADPSSIDTIEYAYLDGQTGPYTETRNGFDVDGVEVKCRHDFGAAAIDYRGILKSNGA